MDKQKIKDDLQLFTGSEKLYRFIFFHNLFYTEGVRYIQNECKAYWLIYVIVYNCTRKLAPLEFFRIKFTVNNNYGVLSFDDGNGNILATVDFPNTDFPLDEIVFYFENSTIYLSSER